MLVYGKVYTARLPGRRLRTVECERCHQPFAYVLTRVGTGKGSAVYGIGGADARQRGQTAAAHDLSRRLASDAELVPCPACQWVDESAVDAHRQRMYPQAPLFLAGLALASLVAAVLAWGAMSDAFGPKSSVPIVTAAAVPAVGLSSPAWGLLILRQRRRARADPNATYPRVPAVPPGTPPALVERTDPATGQRLLVPVPRRAQRDNPADGVVLRPLQVVLPSVCCLCLSERTTGYRPPMATNDASDVAVPVCGDCQRRLRGRWWRRFLLVIVVSLAFAAAGAGAIPGGNPAGRWTVAGIFGGFVGLIAGVVLAGRAARPYRMVVLDADRGVVRFRADHPDYNARVAELALAADAETYAVDPQPMPIDDDLDADYLSADA